MTRPHTCPRCAQRSIDGLLCHDETTPEHANACGCDCACASIPKPVTPGNVRP